MVGGLGERTRAPRALIDRVLAGMTPPPDITILGISAGPHAMCQRQFDRTWK